MCKQPTLSSLNLGFSLLKAKQIITGIFYPHFLCSIKPINFIPCFLVLLLVGCSPRIEVTPPTAPITINMNVKIDHEIHINVDKQVESLIASSPDLFN